jgi:hypothetical protein
MTIVLLKTIMILLSHINEWIIELERVVDAYEAAVDEVEELMDRLERDTRPAFASLPCTAPSC